MRPNPLKPLHGPHIHTHTHAHQLHERIFSVCQCARANSRQAFVICGISIPVMAGNNFLCFPFWCYEAHTHTRAQHRHPDSLSAPVELPHRLPQYTVRWYIIKHKSAHKLDNVHILMCMCVWIVHKMRARARACVCECIS